ncbi:tetratricopeptide repeat protein [Bacillus sonorensis]|uniref:response regulator aspartate phosphatase n=1 Tax=Bacillus sonorensis TaxID=119858 RepID=UPI00227E59EF|nr:tetratricopeptide repeat protein [Bacillus sonorensis]MCY8034003.1 tetratricopeptide repeat protein [Bacillus sonorensis]
MKVIASVDVANLINTWYVHIKKREVSQAIELRDRIVKLFDEMEEDQDVLLYFNLLDYRFRVLMEDIAGKEPSLPPSAEDKAKTDGMLRYYYFLFKGMYESAKNNYSQALMCFRVAERMLDKVEDEIEKAEFHYKLGNLYYFTKTTLLSFHHLSIAKSIYQAYEEYKIQSINCTVLLALNYIDDGRIMRAENMLKACADRLIKMNEYHLLSAVYYDLGFLKIQEDKHTEAIQYFNKSFETNDLKKNAPIMYLQCIYESARSNYKLGNVDKALEWVQKGFEFSQETNNINFSLKFSVLNTCYTAPLDGVDQVKEFINRLEVRKAYVDIEALAEDVAYVYIALKNYKVSTYFLEKAIKSSKLTGKEVL